MTGGAKDDVNSVGNPAAVRETGRLAALTDFITRRVEQVWAKPLRDALYAFKKLDLDVIRAWLHWASGMELYNAGLLMWDRFERNGVTVCRPAPGERIEAMGMAHPYMAASGQSPATQDIELSAGEACLITGANNSGKTSALKSLAQNLMLAQLGFWTPARSLVFKPFKSFVTVFAAGEDATMNQSRYRQEAEAMRAAVDAAGPGAVLFMNESFTSTNPDEAAELLADIAAQLRGKEATLLLVTHIRDVYDLLVRAGAPPRSYVTETLFGPNGCTHTYALADQPPDGLSHARQIAAESGFGIAGLVEDADEARELKKFVRETA